MKYILVIFAFFSTYLSACFSTYFAARGSYAYAASAADFFVEIRSFCGNGLAESDEACDGDDLHGTICVAPSIGSLSCHADCTLNVSQCTVPATPPRSSSGGGVGGGAIIPSHNDLSPPPPAPTSGINKEPGIIEPVLTPFDKDISEEENRARINDEITLFYKRMMEAEPETRKGEHVENYNAPLRIPSDTSGLLVGDFSAAGERGGKAISMIAIQVPSGANPDHLRMTVSHVRRDAFETDEYLTFASDVFDVVAKDEAGIPIRAFQKPLSMSIFVPEGLIGEGNLGVYAQTMDDAPWEKVSGAVFTKTSATFITSHLTRFAIFSAKTPPEIVSAGSVRRIDRSLTSGLVQLSLWMFATILLVLFGKVLSRHTRHRHKTT